jgi:hypothetical protein
VQDGTVVPQRKCIPAKLPQLPQISYSSHYLQVLTKNLDLNLTQILEIKSIQYLKTSIENIETARGSLISAKGSVHTFINKTHKISLKLK